MPQSDSDFMSSMSDLHGGGGSGGAMDSIGKAMGPAGAALGMGAGIVQLLKAHKLKGEAKATMPQLYDPQQQAFLAELAQKRKAMETGAEFAGGMNAIDASTAGTNNSIVQAGGGNVGGTIQGLLQSLRVGQDAKNKVLANGQAQEMQYNSMYERMLNDISGRKLQLQLLQHAQAQSDYAQKQKEGFGNLMGGIGHANPMSSMGGGGAGGGNPMSLLSSLGSGGGAGAVGAEAGGAGGIGSLAALAI
jgi:hypothetical protein